MFGCNFCICNNSIMFDIILSFMFLNKKWFCKEIWIFFLSSSEISAFVILLLYFNLIISFSAVCFISWLSFSILLLIFNLMSFSFDSFSFLFSFIPLFIISLFIVWFSSLLLLISVWFVLYMGLSKLFIWKG